MDWVGSKVTRDRFPEKGEYLVRRVIERRYDKPLFELVSETDPDSPVEVPWDMVSPVW